MAPIRKPSIFRPTKYILCGLVRLRSALLRMKYSQGNRRRIDKSSKEDSARVLRSAGDAVTEEPVPDANEGAVIKNDESRRHVKINGNLGEKQVSLDLRDDLAAIWQEILHAKPDTMFGSASHRIEDRHSLGDEIPQPGFVGTRYRSGGVLFLGKNPGKGGALMSQEDALQFEVLHRLRDANLADLRTRFDDLCKLLGRRVMPTWGVVQNYVMPVLSGAGAELDDIAYLNLLKWRSEDTSADLFNASWAAHTGKQYSKLNPGLVIAIGISTRDLLEKLLRKFGERPPANLFFLERSRRDAMAPPASTIARTPEIAKEVAARLRRSAAE